MKLKEKLLLIGDDTRAERESNLSEIKKVVAENNYSIDFEKEISELTEDDYYHLGRGLNLLDFSRPYFPTALVEETKNRIEEIGQVINLEYSVPQDFTKIMFFNIFDLTDEGYEFTANTETINHNLEIIQTCLDTLYINTGLSRSLKTKCKSDDFDLTKFRSTENLLVLYLQKEDNQTIFYCLTNSTTDTYKLLNEVSTS